MNKQEAIEKLKEVSWECEDSSLVISLDYTQEIISQIDEPQKVTIPKFVAEWLKKYRYAHTLLKVLNSAEKEQIATSAVNDWILDNQYDFIKAWIDGYEVGKMNKLEYTVLPTCPVCGEVTYSEDTCPFWSSEWSVDRARI